MGKVEDFEAQVERADGEKIWVCLNAGAVYGDSGEISAIEGGLEDITERKRVESMIIQAKKDWESTFDSVEDIIVVFDGDMRVRRLNWALAKRLEIHPRDAVGKSCEEIFDPGAKKAKVCPRIKTMLGGGERAAEMRIPALDGDFLVTVSRFLGSEDPASEETALVVTAHDVSERKMLEDKLRQSQKMEAIGTLAGGIAHDFNNILGVMMGYSEMCLEQFGAEEAAKKRLKEIIKAGNRASDLIRQILTFSRQEESDLRPLKLAPAVKEIVRMLKASLPSNIEMKVELSGGPDTVRANLTQMHQVILNLCTNAAQAMPETGGAVSLALDLAGHGEEDREARERLGDAPLARLTVEDSGKGIDPAIIHNIFDPFFTTRKGGGGTGMGLALVHGIVTSHGGAVTVQSEPGKGSAFRVYLPLTEGEVEAPAKEEQPAPKAKGRALVVDDEEELAEIGKTMLEGLGFEAVAVSSSLAALEAFNREPESFDLLLTDQTMPGLSGAELSARVLARRPDLPVIVCTGFSETLSREKARDMGIREYLLKPVLKKDLSAAIGRIYSTAKA
jgi:PAS domain S-box-containing protein